MADEPRKPTVTPRAGTHVGDRGELRARPAPPRQDDDAVPVAFDTPITGVFHDPIVELRMRTQRIQRLTEGSVTATAARLTAVEAGVQTLSAKQDASDQRIVALLEGQNRILPDLVEMAKMRANEGHVEALAKVAVGQARELDKVEAGKDKRRWVTQILAAAAGGGGLLELLHRVGGC